MGFLSAIGGALSAVGSAISGAVRAVASGIGKAVSTLGPTLATWAGRLNTAITWISAVVQVVGLMMKILKPGEKIEDIGERALQAEEMGITLDRCDKDFNAYMEKIRNLELDPEKARLRPETDKALAGCLTVEKGLETLWPHMSTSELWPIIARSPDFFNAARMEVYARLAMEQKLDFGKVLAKYFEAGPKDRLESPIRDYVWDAEKKYNPSETPREIMETLNKVRDNLAKGPESH